MYHREEEKTLVTPLCRQIVVRVKTGANRARPLWVDWNYKGENFLGKGSFVVLSAREEGDGTLGAPAELHLCIFRSALMRFHRCIQWCGPECTGGASPIHSCMPSCRRWDWRTQLTGRSAPSRMMHKAFFSSLPTRWMLPFLMVNIDLLHTD